MKNDTLNDVVTSLEEWCRTNGISVFYGSTIEEDLEIIWDKKTDADWKKFLEVQKKAESKILILNIIKNEVEDFSDDIKELGERLKAPELHEFKEALKTVRKNEGQIVSFELGFYYNNKCYKYYASSHWIEQYHTLMDFLDKSSDLIENDFDKKTTNLRTEEYIKKIIENNRYLSASNQMQREDIVSHILLQEGVEDRAEVFRIAKIAESKFILEIKPKQEEERKNLILGLKRQGYNKKQTISKSGLGETIVDKYWYIDD